MTLMPGDYETMVNDAFAYQSRRLLERIRHAQEVQRPRLRITASDNYRHDDCALDGCHRLYCPEHRLLWRECETAQMTKDGSGRTWFELGDCPSCEADARRKRLERLKEAV